VTGQHATPDRLRTAPLTVLAVFLNASNATFLVHLDDRAPAPDPDDVDEEDLAGLEPADLGVWKPAAGQAPLWDFDAATLPRREVAAHLVDAALGTNLVPPTVWRVGPQGPGSLQAYVAHDPAAHLLTWIEEEHADADTLADLVVLDLVINNTDRKAGHVLVAPGGERVWAIDHGVTFHVDDKVRTVAWQLEGEPVPADLRQRAGELGDRLREDPSWLRAHLADREVLATIRRAHRVAAMEAFPALVDRAQLPWPLV
jgi:uncharacterized repeat protein (TIGR03843 family)